MKTISIYDYNESMGQLIDVQHPLDYAKKHDPRSINIYADRLLMNHQKYLNKQDVYYIICEKGRLSSRVVNTLSYYGYKVIRVQY